MKKIPVAVRDEILTKFMAACMAKYYKNMTKWKEEVQKLKDKGYVDRN